MVAFLQSLRVHKSRRTFKAMTRNNLCIISISLDEIFKNKVWLRYVLNQIGDMEIPGISYQPCFNFRSMTPLFAIMSITKKTPLRFSDTHYLSSRAVGIREA